MSAFCIPQDPPLTVRQSIAKSADAFTSSVWPIIGGDIGGGDVYPLEAAAGPFANLLDYAGHDYWQHCPESGGVRLLASRVQWGQWWETFTIRVVTDRGNRETEYAKKVRALDSRADGWILPAVTVQAYLDGDSVRLAGSCLDTDALIHAARDVVEEHDLLRNPRRMADSRRWSFRRGPDGAWFVALWWDWLESDYGARIVRHGA